MKQVHIDDAKKNFDMLVLFPLEWQDEKAIKITDDDNTRAVVLAPWFYRDLMNTIYGVNIQPCGHPLSAIVSSDGGTSYCRMCEEEAQDE